MTRQPAKVLEAKDVRRLLKHVQSTRYPPRNTAMVLLSFKAGLRACEIAGLTWEMVLSVNGKLSPTLSVSDDEEGHHEITAVAVKFWRAVAENMPQWAAVKTQHMRAMELRQESLASHATVMRALGGAGAELMREYPDTWEDRLKALPEIDWKKSNSEWNGVCIIAGSVSSNRQSRQATKAFVKRALGLSLTDAEVRSLTPPEQQVSEVAV